MTTFYTDSLEWFIVEGDYTYSSLRTAHCCARSLRGKCFHTTNSTNNLPMHTERFHLQHTSTHSNQHTFNKNGKKYIQITITTAWKNNLNHIQITGKQNHIFINVTGKQNHIYINVTRIYRNKCLVCIEDYCDLVMAIVK